MAYQYRQKNNHNQQNTEYAILFQGRILIPSQYLFANEHNRASYHGNQDPPHDSSPQIVNGKNFGMGSIVMQVAFSYNKHPSKPGDDDLSKDDGTEASNENACDT